MANITSSASWIQTASAQFRRAVSESLIQTMGGSINLCLDRALLDVTTAYGFKNIGTFTVGVPAKAAFLVVTGCGGGGAGRGSYNSNKYGGGGGGGGAFGTVILPCGYVAGNNISITVGAGGTFTSGGTGIGGKTSVSCPGGVNGNTVYASWSGGMPSTQQLESSPVALISYGGESGGSGGGAGGNGGYQPGGLSGTVGQSGYAAGGAVSATYGGGGGGSFSNGGTAGGANPGIGGGGGGSATGTQQNGGDGILYYDFIFHP